jgi:hypothetical protein
MSLRLGVDLDGVVADFRSSFERAAKEAGVVIPSLEPSESPVEPMSTRDIKRTWDHVRRAQNWWVKLEAYEPQQIARLYETSRRLNWEVVFMTRRPTTAGDPVQFQSQWWLEEQGFFYPAVVTVPGSRGELANALRLDLILDDQLHNCVDVVSASAAKAVLLLRDDVDATTRDRALSRGIGVVSSLREAIDIAEHFNETIKERRGKLQRLSDWFTGGASKGSALPTTPDRSRVKLK